MQSNNLQALLALNASRITTLHEDIEDTKSLAKQWADDGERSFAVEEYTKVARLRRKLAKAVELQRTMKVELQAIQRENRIESKIAQFNHFTGLRFVRRGDKTAVETEADLDDMIDILVSKKADSRTA